MKLTPAQEAALARIRAEGVLYSFNGVTRATVRRLELLELVDVEWTTETWTIYRTKRQRWRLTFAARPRAEEVPLES